MLPRPLTPTLFPYTTLFRSLLGLRPQRVAVADVHPVVLPERVGDGVGEGEHAVLPEPRSEEHTSELQSRFDLVCRLLLEKKKTSRVRSSAGMYSPACARHAP